MMRLQLPDRQRDRTSQHIDPVQHLAGRTGTHHGYDFGIARSPFCGRKIRRGRSAGVAVRASFLFLFEPKQTRRTSQTDSAEKAESQFKLEEVGNRKPLLRRQ